ncbi:hypothetical protein [Saccharolobus islandicus]|uniref:hypothetical protein n=1 Tax=Saccharolobus islandicus TaxID=43080 RepID=UPI00117F62F7|nr:hypothetical protein [Sulfolobus islandicus]
MSLTTAQYSLLLAASLIGMIPGSILFGWLSDKMGRNKIIDLDLFFLVFGINPIKNTSPEVISDRQ